MERLRVSVTAALQSVVYFNTEDFFLILYAPGETSFFVKSKKLYKIGNFVYIPFR